MDSEDACERSSFTPPAPLVPHNQSRSRGPSTHKQRVRSNTISRHTKGQCKPSPLNTNTLPNPKTRGHHRSTTHPRSSVDSSPLTALSALTDFISVSSTSSVTAPVTPTTSARSKNPASSSSSGIDSALSAAAFSYGSQPGFLQDYSCFTGHTTPPPEYQEYSPSEDDELRLRHTYMDPLPRPAAAAAAAAIAPSEYQEPNVDPPPLPLPNVRPDSPECSASSLDDSLGSLKYQPSLLLTDYLDFPTSRSSSTGKGHKSKSKCKSASPRTPRTPDSGLHHQLIPEPHPIIGQGKAAAKGKSQSVEESIPLKVNAAALLEYALEKKAVAVASSVSRKSLSLSDASSRAVSLPHGAATSSHDACGLCASLGSPWVDICRAVRASKTK